LGAADGSTVNAEFKDGVLKVHLPKGDKAKTEGRRSEGGVNRPSASRFGASAGRILPPLQQ
jgi:hypothetical protein